MHALIPGRQGRSPWQTELRQAYARLDELLAALGLSAEACGVSTEAAASFPLRVPRGFVARMRHGDPADPLLRQVLPVEAETHSAPGFGPDPVGDLDSVLAPGLLQKYAGRALLITTGACAVHCRYCFRRNFPYAEHSATPAVINAALDTIAADGNLQEIILSGGDPLALGNGRLGGIIAALERIPHIARIRLHTRLPVVLPERVDAELLALLRNTRKPVVTVIHANHAQEIDDAVTAALGQLRGVSAALLNQSVLLRGVNDSTATLTALSNRLFSAGVMPYYLHQLDRVAGAAHFLVPDSEALALHAAMAAQLPGYLVPKLVHETAGAAAKTPLEYFGTT
jgi:EF-P beta-lysylation protein EpmB